MKTALPNLGGADRRVIGGMTLSLVLGLMTAVARAQVPCSYEVTILPQIQCPNYDISGTIAGFNSLGQAVLVDMGCTAYHYSAYVWDGGATFDVVPKPPGILWMVPSDINDAGLIVGEMGETQGTVGTHGFIYDLNTGEFVAQLESLDPEGRCLIFAINELGMVCGTRTLDDGGDPQHPWQPFIWDAKTGFIDLPEALGSESKAFDISDTGEVVGLVWGGAFKHFGFHYADGAFTLFGPVPNGITSSANGVNNAGQIIIGGFIQTDPFIVRSFLYENGIMTELPVPAGFDSTGALRITDDGLIIGRTSLAGPSINYGCIWYGGAVTMLDDLVDPSENLQIELPVRITNDGRILTTANHKVDGGVIALLTPVKSLPGDGNCDQTVNVDDLLDVINSWGACSQCQVDFDRNGVVNGSDLAIVIENWIF